MNREQSPRASKHTNCKECQKEWPKVDTRTGGTRCSAQAHTELVLRTLSRNHSASEPLLNFNPLSNFKPRGAVTQTWQSIKRLQEEKASDQTKKKDSRLCCRQYQYNASEPKAELPEESSLIQP